MTTISSRQFNQHTGEAKKATEAGPVLITDRGRTTHVLLKFEDYQEMRKPGQSGYDLFVEMAAAVPGIEDIDFDIPELKGDWGLKIPDFSE